MKKTRGVGVNRVDEVAGVLREARVARVAKKDSWSS